MKIPRRSSHSGVEVYTASLSDIMFFLLLFFLIMSTLVNPSVIRVFLPKTKAAEQAIEKRNINLSVSAEKNYYINDKPVMYEQLEPTLKQMAEEMPTMAVIIRMDKTLAVQELMQIMEIGVKLKIKMSVAIDTH